MMQQLQSRANELDRKDSLAQMREQYYIPKGQSGDPQIYLCGNSLGLQPKNAKDYILQELEDWKNLGVEGHFHAKHPWMPYHEFLTANMSEIVGAKQSEVVIMNSLTVNLHLLMVSFFRPEKGRSKILIEANAFPSDRYAVESQLKFHRLDPEEHLMILPASDDKSYTDNEDILHYIKKYGDEIALILIGGVNYYSGQAFPLKKIVEAGKERGCMVGFDLAHGAGNIICDLHNAGPDFAAWCSYKYLNSGPGGLSGVFVHERHANNFDLPRFAGWWGHDKESRFKMPEKFKPQEGAEGWQLSNPPIFPMASLRASLELFCEVGMPSLRQKSVSLTNFLEECINSLLSDEIQIITPEHPEDRGCQLSLRLEHFGRSVYERLIDYDIVADWREPDIIRVAPVPMYNTFQEVFEFVKRLKIIISRENKS